MKTKILALYLGCECVTKYVDWTDWGRSITLKLSTIQRAEDDSSFQIKLLLRPLSSMTEEEDQKEFPENNRGNFIDMHWYPEGFQWLLSKGFDLFGLIESGQAIDSTNP